MRRRPNLSTRNFDAIRARSSPLDNAVIDEFLARRIGRREFLRYASVLGISAPLLGALMPGAARAPDFGGQRQANRDGSLWTFKIRRGEQFHDGGTLPSADVVATIDRLAD